MLSHHGFPDDVLRRGLTHNVSSRGLSDNALASRLNWHSGNVSRRRLTKNSRLGLPDNVERRGLRDNSVASRVT